jgi:DNA helicase-2/ATP-dependent DNA helicase PcrA
MKSYKHLYNSLNEYQKLAVDQTEGPVMVIAGPGTGKTQLLSVRIMNMLLGESQITPNMILCLTYTEAGVVAMKKRLTDFIGPEAYKIPIHTFHSLCNEIVQYNMDYFRLREMEPASDVETIQVLRECIAELSVENPLYRAKGDQYYEVTRLKNLFRIMKEEFWSPEMVIDRCNQYIKEMPELDEFKYKRANAKENIKVGDVKKKEIEKVVAQLTQLMEASKLLPVYDAKMAKRGRYDFNDMILWVINAFNDSEWIKLTYQEKYQYVMVDELQDTNGSQLELLRLLMDFYDTPNLFGVGDLKQTIYEFSGARVANIDTINQRYLPSIITLQENYRSSQSILDTATRMIQQSARFQGESPLISRVSPEDETAPVAVEFPNELAEQLSVVRSIKWLIEHDVSPSDIAIIFRKHRQGEFIAKALRVSGIPINIKRRTNILDVPMIRNLITLMRASLPQQMQYYVDEIARFDFTQKKLGITNKDLETWQVIRNKDGAQIPEFMVKLQEGLSDLATRFVNDPFILVMEQVLYEYSILDAIRAREDHLQLAEYVHTFFFFLKEEVRKNPLHTLSTLISLIDMMIEEGIPIPSQNISSQEEGVNLLTCHGAKGLEFSYVFMVGCTANEWESSRAPANTYSFPPTLYVTQEDKEESNRRLFYVAMTRAKKMLQMSYAVKTPDEKDLVPSLFIVETGIQPIPVNKPITEEELFEINTPEKAFSPAVDKKILAERLQNFQLSVSSANKYLKCQVAFYFENILRVPFVPSGALLFGNATHRALKMAYDYFKKNSKIMPVEEFLDLFEKDLIHHRGNVSRDEFERRMALKPLLSEYWEKHYVPSNKIVLTEYKVRNIIISGVPFEGDFDKLEFDGLQVDIVDYKTGRYNYTKSNLKPGKDYWRQLISYKLMLDQLTWTGWKFRSARIEMIDNEFMGPISFSFSQEDEELVKQDLLKAYNGIMNLEFDHGCGEADCKWCNL